MIKCWVFPKKLHQSHNTFGQWQLKIDLGHYLWNILHLHSRFVWVLQSHHNFVVPWVFCKWCCSDQGRQGLLRPVCYANGTHQLDWKSKLNSWHLRKSCFKTDEHFAKANELELNADKEAFDAFSATLHFHQKIWWMIPSSCETNYIMQSGVILTQLIIKIDWKKPKNWYSVHPFSLPKTVAVIGSKFSFD